MTLDHHLEPEWVDERDDSSERVELDPDQDRDRDEDFKAYDRWVETHMGWGE